MTMSVRGADAFDRAHQVQLAAAQLASQAAVGQTATRAPSGSYSLEPSYHPQLAQLVPFAPLGPVPQAPPTGPVSFADRVGGQDSQAIDLELMQISEAMYDPSVQSVGKWNRVDDQALLDAGIDPAMLENEDTGFRADVFTDGDGNYVLAYCGSNEGNDWFGTNFPQGLGWDTEQYDQAAQLAQLVSEAYGDDVVITGHSLGGGLAATGSMASGIPAVTFDGSGVHDNTLERLGLDPQQARDTASDGQIRAYSVEHDPLTVAQEDVPGLSHIMPDAMGHRITLDNPLTPPSPPEWTWNPIEMAKRTGEYLDDLKNYVADAHRQGTMIEALETQRPWED